MTARSPWSLVTAAGAGLIFGIGLAVAQMTNPQKVQNFLDIAGLADGTWDPSLAFVMGAGVLVTMILYRVARPLQAPLLVPAFAGLRAAGVDRPLLIGTAVFGVGWGLSGLCPGPAIADLGLIPGDIALFAAAMLGGSWGASLLLARRGGDLVHGDAPAG